VQLHPGPVQYTVFASVTQQTLLIGEWILLHSFTGGRVHCSDVWHFVVDVGSKPSL
jgi:hypothetical protein